MLTPPRPSPSSSKRGLERRRGAMPMLARFGARIEVAGPLPAFGRVRIADATADRAGANVAVMDLPAIAVGIAAAGQEGHGRI